MQDPNFSRTQFPPGGFEFYQPQTRWWAPLPKANTFDQTVRNIIKHRLANPAPCAGLPTDEGAVGNELENYTRARLGMLPMGAGAPKPAPVPSSPSMAPAVQAAVADIKKMASGMAVLFDWEVSGLPPVAAELATARASVCATCPKNEAGGLAKYFKEPIANNIRKRLARLHAMNLTTPSDAQLDTCAACLCVLKLKVWAPMELIQKHLKPEVKADLDPRCWILSGQ